MSNHWLDGEDVTVAEWWSREEVEKEIYQLSDGQVIDAQVYASNSEAFMAAGIQPVQSRKTASHKVTQRIMSGVEILEEVPSAGLLHPDCPRLWG